MRSTSSASCRPSTQMREALATRARWSATAIEPEALAMIARAADGSVRDGLSLLDQAIAMPSESGAGAIGPP